MTLVQNAANLLQASIPKIDRAWLPWDARMRAQLVLGSGEGSSFSWKQNISAHPMPPTALCFPRKGGRLSIWNNANGVIQVSVLEIKSVTPFCRFIISTFGMQGACNTRG